MQGEASEGRPAAERVDDKAGEILREQGFRAPRRGPLLAGMGRRRSASGENGGDEGVGSGGTAQGAVSAAGR